MTNQEAKFILAAYRPDGRDSCDPIFAEALAHAERDPELRAWFEHQQQLDSQVAAKLCEIAPPPELRAAILAGARACRRSPRWRIAPLWIAAAAAVLIGIVTFSTLRSGAATDLRTLAEFALTDMLESHEHHDGYPPALGDVQARLAALSKPLTSAGGITLDLDDLRRKKCRSVRIAGLEVFEICFQRDGTWYHLYAARRKRADAGRPAKPLNLSRGQFAAASWTDGDHLYALVATSQEELRKLI